VWSPVRTNNLALAPAMAAATTTVTEETVEAAVAATGATKKIS